MQGSGKRWWRMGGALMLGALWLWLAWAAGVGTAVHRPPASPLDQGELPPDQLSKRRLGYGEQHLWTYTLTTSTQITLGLAPGVTGDGRLTLLDPEGAVIAVQDDAPAGGPELLSGLVLTGTGSYGILVEDANGRAGNYGLLLQTAVSSPLALQPSLRYGDVVTSFLPALTGHLWQFDGLAGQAITVRGAPEAPANLTLALYDEAMNLLALLAEPDQPGVVRELIDFPLPANGFYTIWLGEYEGGPASYQLSLDGPPPPTPAPAYLPVVLVPPPTPTPSPTSTPSPTPTATPTVAMPDWLAYVNRFRSEVGLAHLGENPDWSYGGYLHGRYMVKNDVISHSEDPTNPWYTPEGDAAGRNGNIAVSSWSSAADRFAIDLWMAGPFHAIAIIDPELHTTGYGAYREAIGLWRMGATMDVSRGRGSLPPGITFPITFPADGGQTWLLRHDGNEWPNPLTSCPGYVAPTGPPLMIQIGSGGLIPSVTGSSFTRDGVPLEHCVFDETNYSNLDAAQQSSGRIVLNIRDAIVLMPRQPLTVGQAYTASITTNGSTYSWTFTAVAPPGYPRPVDTAVRSRIGAGD